MFERYTEKARRVIFFSRYEASQFGGPYIETEHLLLGILREDKALANRFIGPFEVSEAIRKQIEAQTPRREKVSTSVDMPLTGEAKRVLAYASEEAERLEQKDINTEHLLLGLLREEKSFAAQLLMQHGLSVSAVREELAQSPRLGVRRPLISESARNLTEAAGAGDLETSALHDPVVNRIIEILWRKTKNCPILISDDPATATPVLERLAVRISKRDVPAFFFDKRVLALDISRFPSAALRTLFRELMDQHNDILVFTGQIESLFRPGDDSLGAEGLLKLMLNMRRVQWICAATAAEHRKWIGDDPALEQHFEPVELGGAELESKY